MRKVLLIQRKYTDNLGDVAIGKSMCYLLASHDCEVFHHEFCSLSKTNAIDTSIKVVKRETVSKSSLSSERLPGFLKKYYWLYRHRSLFKGVVSRRYDKVVIGGGELIQCGSFSLALYWWVRLLSFFQPKTDIILFSVGVFDKWGSYDRKLVSKALDRVANVYVRDEKSAENLRFFFGKQSKVVPDSVFVNPIDKGPINNHVIYGITPFSRFLWHSKIALYTDIDTFYEKCRTEIEAYLGSGKSVSLFYTTKDDLNSCYSFNQYCSDKYGCSYPIASIQTLDDLISVIKGSDIVVSARMHACILATLLTKQVCPIVLSEKMKSFVIRYMNLKDEDYRLFVDCLNNAICEALDSK